MNSPDVAMKNRGADTQQAPVPGALTRALAGFAAGADFDAMPAEMVLRAKLLILDCLGNQIGAHGEDAPRIVYETIAAQGSGPCTIAGWGTTSTPLVAALVNGTLAHAGDMDDAHRDSLTKTGSAITPAAMAMAEAVGADGKRVIAAVIAGYEVMIRLGLAMNPSHRQRGFHSTATLGAFGAAVVAGSLLKLDVDQMQSALGVAGTQAAGLAAFINNPSMIKPFNVGRGVQSGVLAALLAHRGFIGPPDILEGQEGFLRAFADTVNVRHLTDGLGERYHLLECGFKPHAACRYAHGPIDAAVELMKVHRFTVADITHVDAYVSELAYRQSSFYEPRNLSSAQGSGPFSIASGITQGVRSLSLGHMRKAFSDPATWDLHKRVVMHVDPEMGYMARGCRLHVTLKDGKSHVLEVSLPRGEPENPMTDSEVRGKFHSQTGAVVGEANAAALEAAIDALERQTALRPVMALTARIP